MPKYFWLLVLVIIIDSAYSQTQKNACHTSTNDQGAIIDDCPALQSCIEGVCVHKDIFPLTSREIFGAVIMMICSGLANSGGIGGGGFQSPLLLLVFTYSTTKAVMIVYVLIFGGSLGNFLNIAFQRDIFTGRPLILYDLALIVTPAMLIGSNIGVLLNRACPPILTICGLIYFHTFILKKMQHEAKVNIEIENKMRKQSSLLHAQNQSEQKTTNNTQSVELKPIGQHNSSEAGHEEFVPYELKQILDEENSFLPLRKIAVLLSLLLYVIIVTILRGTEQFHSIIGVEYCGFGYWFWFLITLGGCFAFFLRGTKMVQRTIEIKKRFRYTKDSFTLTNEDIKKLGYKGIGAGLIAGLLGMGGGVLLSTVVISMGVKAQSMVATFGFFVVMVAFISLFQAFLYGGITSNELMFFFLVSIIGSYVVSSGLSYLVRKYRRPSILLMVLCGMLYAILVILPCFAIYKIIQDPQQMIAVRSIC